VVLDLETSSTADLRRTGSHAYAEDPQTRVTCLCYALDNGPVQTWVSGPAPGDFTDAVTSGAVMVSHNYQFEDNVYRHILVPLGWPEIGLSQWSCTMARSLVAGYPASLDLAGRAIGTSHQKDRSAHGLMLRFARPRSLSPLTWWHETDPVRFRALCEYCAQDVEAERALDRALPELSPRERLVFELDYRINQRGLGIDHALVDRLAALAGEAQDELRGLIAQITNGMVRSLNQVSGLRTWLACQGVVTPDLKRDTVRTLLRDKTITGPPRAALQARADAARASTAKLAAITAARSRDGRVRGTLQYYGANRTGRWAGRRVQGQNFPRGTVKDVPGALRLIRGGAGARALDLLCEDSALGVVSSCLRSTIVAAPGNRLVIADFAQIEARVLAWLAGQQDVLDVFKSGQDIYVATAARIGSANRLLGKVLVLACGYGMGPARFQETAAGYGLSLDMHEAETAVMSWREANPRVVDFWRGCQKAVQQVMRTLGASERVGAVTFIHRPGLLLARLPCGRHLTYRAPRLDVSGQGRNEISYRGSLGGNWVRLRTWGGKIVENLSQAVARDVMVEAMLQLGGVDLIATVHDELIAEAPEARADAVLGLMLATMRVTPAWAPGLPMEAAGAVVRRYTKG